MLNLGHHSWHDFLAVAAKRVSGPAVPGAGDSSMDSLSDFRGTRTLQEAIDMAVKGWQDGAKAIAKVLDTLPPSAEVLPDWSLDVAGSICNVPAFIAGEPECMWRMSECKRDEHRVTLIVPGTYNGGIRPSDAQRYATAIAAVVRALEASGINPAVYSLSVTVKHRIRVVSSVAVREFGEPLDLAKVAMAFHPAFLRRIEFAWREMNPEAVRAGVASNGYGQSGHPTTDEIMALLGDVGYVAIAPPVEDAVTARDIIQFIHNSVSEQIRQIR